MTNSTHATKGFIDRLLLINKHEYAAVAWSFLYFFCVLSSYYMLRSVRETMATQNGVTNLPLLFTGSFVVMLLVSPFFGWISSRFTRRRFLPWVYLFFIANMLLFWAAFTYRLDNDLEIVWLGRGFFVWLSVFNLFVVSVFWSFMADTYSQAQGRRLFGFISAGGSAGALLGPLATTLIVSDIGFQNILPLSAVVLSVAVFCIGRVGSWVNEEKPTINEAQSRKALGGSALGGIRQLFSSRYLLVISATSIIASLLGTAHYTFLIALVGDAYTTANERTEFFSLLDLLTNLLALIGALFFVNRSVRGFGIGITLTLLPIISIIGFALTAMSPTLAVVAILGVVRRGIGFGFTKPTNDMLYSVVTPTEKYKAKNFIDTAVYRGGDVFGVWSVNLILPFLAISGVSLVMLPFAAIWAGLGVWLGKDYKRRDASGLGGETT